MQHRVEQQTKSSEMRKSGLGLQPCSNLLDSATQSQ
jgi:hypothetical protein